MADSAAATVNTNKLKIWPVKSFKYTENVIKFILIANNINSIDIKIIIIFFFTKKIPKIPIKNKKTEINKNFIISTVTITNKTHLKHY